MGINIVFSHMAANLHLSAICKREADLKRRVFGNTPEVWAISGAVSQNFPSNARRFVINVIAWMPKLAKDGLAMPEKCKQLKKSTIFHVTGATEKRFSILRVPTTTSKVHVTNEGFRNILLKLSPKCINTAT
ncbi:hypothetical protein CEXT_52651 [Caerostris extrusa]|uniref:Transposase n=1 Tax=Caerostris extrusa TaxID=172846 RepID=A0AAV4NHY0_CAEEX|nr:hypothetical protein CEXT_52651 [Caerostris extrusa]